MIEHLVCVQLPKACFGFVVRDGNVVWSQCAPLAVKQLRQARIISGRRAVLFYRRMGAKVTWTRLGQ